MENLIDELKQQLNKITEDHVNSRPIKTLEEYSKHLASAARARGREDVAQDAEEIIKKVIDAYDQGLNDLELLAAFMNEEMERGPDAVPGMEYGPDKIQIGGYLLFLIVGKNDGTKVTVNRTIKPEHKDVVEQYFSGKTAEVTESELEEFDKFLSTL